jgi:hypothetical protein
MRIIVFIITAGIQLAFAAAGLLMLLLVMNGYSESDATPGLIAYIALALISAVGLGGASVFLAKHLVEKRSFGGFAASAIAVVSFTFLGGVVVVASFFIAIILAEISR